jgi:hypothetical protein
VTITKEAATHSEAGREVEAMKDTRRCDSNESGRSALRPGQILWPVLATVAVGSVITACGESSGFKGSGAEDKPPKKTVTRAQPPPAPQEQDIRGYTAPPLRGTNAELIGGGPASLGSPDTPEAVPVPTEIKDGIKTKIADPTGPVTTDSTAVTCPNGIIFTNGSCMSAVPIYLWTKDDSDPVLSRESANCDSAAGLCKKLSDNGFSSSEISFYSIQPDAQTLSASPGSFKRITICHGGIQSGYEKIVASTGEDPPCTAESETFIGLSTEILGATKPVFKWTKGPAATLSLSNSSEPDAGYVIDSSGQPLFYGFDPDNASR